MTKRSQLIIMLAILPICFVSYVQGADSQCDSLIYAVHDGDMNNTQFLTINPLAGFKVAPLGPEYPGKNIEGLDIHPLTGELFGVSGGDQSEAAGHLYRINKSDGGLSDLGPIHFDYEGTVLSGRGISSLSFHPDGSLWGWTNECGLLQINEQTAAAELKLQFTSPEVCRSGKLPKDAIEVDDLTWDNQGKVIYAAAGNEVWTYTYQTGELKQVARLSSARHIETLKMLPEGLLLVGVHGSGDQDVEATTLKVLNPETGKIETDFSVKMLPYYDVEGVAVSSCFPKRVRVTVTPEEGGSLKIEERLVVTVPAGAVSKPTVLWAMEIDPVKGIQNGAIMMTEADRWSFVYILGPEGMEFSRPVMVTVSYNPDAVLSQGVSENDLTILQNRVSVPSKVDTDAHTATTLTYHFSTFNVGTTVLPSAPMEEEQSNTLPASASEEGEPWVCKKDGEEVRVNPTLKVHFEEMLRRLDELKVGYKYKDIFACRTKKEAHRYSTASMIYNSTKKTKRGMLPEELLERELLERELLERLKALTDGKDKDQNVWYEEQWEKEFYKDGPKVYGDEVKIRSYSSLEDYLISQARRQALKNASDIKRCPNWNEECTLPYAEEGYGQGNLWRAPNLPKESDIPVSRHTLGMAVDLRVEWGKLGGEWSDAAIKIVEESGLYRPLSPKKYQDRGPYAQIEHWHFELPPSEEGEEGDVTEVVEQDTPADFSCEFSDIVRSNFSKEEDFQEVQYYMTTLCLEGILKGSNGKSYYSRNVTLGETIKILSLASDSTERGLQNQYECSDTNFQCYIDYAKDKGLTGLPKDAEGNVKVNDTVKRIDAMLYVTKLFFLDDYQKYLKSLDTGESGESQETAATFLQGQGVIKNADPTDPKGARFKDNLTRFELAVLAIKAAKVTGKGWVK